MPAKDDAVVSLSPDPLPLTPLPGTLLTTLAASNLTSGLGGKGREYTDIDFVRAIRHGIGKDRKSLVIMPSQYFNKFSDEDVGAIVAYLKSLPPVDNEDAHTSLGPLGRIIALFDTEILPASSPSEDYLNGACGSATMDRDN